MNLWCWLNSNSAAVQSIAAMVSTVLALVTVFVLISTRTSIKKQAEAARALTEVAQDQTKVANNAAESARKQSELLSSQIEQSVAPLLVAEPEDRSPLPYSIPKYWPDTHNKLVNRGSGVAFQILYWEGGLEVMNQGSFPITQVQPSTLGPGNSAYLQISPVWEAFTVMYKCIRVSIASRVGPWFTVIRTSHKIMW
jgi:hypothetical protein